MEEVRKRTQENLKKKGINIEDEHLKLIIDNFWKGLKYFITNAHEAKEGILINKYFTFKLKIKAIYRYVYKNEEYNDKYNNHPAEYWENVINNIKKLGNK